MVMFLLMRFIFSSDKVGNDLRFSADKDVLPSGAVVQAAGSIIIVDLYSAGRNPGMMLHRWWCYPGVMLPV